MKRNRLLFCLLWLLSLAGISFYGGTVSYGFFAVFTLLPLVALVYLLCVFLTFRIYQRLETKQLVAKESIPFYFILKNESFFSFVSIRVRFFSRFSSIIDLEDGVEYALFPGKEIEKKTHLLCKYRGEYEVGIKTVEIQDFLRLFKISYRNPETMRVIVKPKLIHLERIQGLEQMLQSQNQTTEPQTRRDVLVREYLPGDDIRNMHWSSTARTSKLMVRKQTGETKSGIGIYLCPIRISAKQEEYLPVENKALEIVLALAGYFAKNNIQVRGFLGNEKGEQRIAKLTDFEPFYQEVSGVVFSEAKATGLADYLQNKSLSQCQMLFVVLSSLTSEIEFLLRKLEEQQVPVVVYLVTSQPKSKWQAFDKGKTVFCLVSPEDELGEVM